MCLSGNADTSILDRFELTKYSYYFYVGNNRPHKNINRLKKAFTNLECNTKLVIAGHTGLNKGGIVYTGYISDDELIALYSYSKKFIFPSLYEGFGLPILESLNYKRPVIASNIKAFKEFQSTNILFFNPLDEGSIENAMLIDQIYSEEDAQKVLNRFSWEKTFKDLDIFLKKLISET
jgi:glycosyltransferase involved in cell wall biosynthesis